MTEPEAIEFCKNNPEAAAKIIMMVEALTKRVAELEEKLSLNSTNSSKPPSSDNKLTKASKRVNQSNKKRGAQLGHKGKTLKLSATPNKIEVLLPLICNSCQHNLESIKSTKIERRQLIELPEIRMYTTEYQAHTKICPCCSNKTKAEFPKGIKATTQYGDNLKSFISYCNSYQMLPYERISELIEDLVSHKISVGSIYNFLQTQYEELYLFQQNVKKELLKEEVIHSDETGINIQGKLHWIHVASSSYLTYYQLHKKRGKIAMDDMGILANYKGTAVHDHWRAYNQYTCNHAYCNAHVLRELTRTSEVENVQWSRDMFNSLTQMNVAVHKAKDKNKESLSSNQIKKFTKKYTKICNSANNYYPPPENEKISRGRPKQKKGKNLLDRLLKYQKETLRFLNDFKVPFTNNLAERDLRMIKVKEKISGCFASFHGGEIFCRIRSYISTLKKNNFPVLQGLKDALEGKSYVPCGGGC